MSLERTAEIFKNQSEEQIMNWMVRNMTSEQIKSCFEDDLSEAVPQEALPQEELPQDPLLKLRKLCSNKRYVIHKIEGDTVWFWYYVNKSKKWVYYNKPLTDFREIDGKIEECGEDTLVTEDIEDDLKEAYNLNTDEEFKQVKQEYKDIGINKNWLVNEQLNNLVRAIQYQKESKLDLGTKESRIINFSPVLIESISGNKVNYYYLINDKGNVSFIEGNLSIDKLQNDLSEIIDDLKLNIIGPGDAGGSDAKDNVGWTKSIKEAVQEIPESDLVRIKQIYSKFPLSDESPYFMKGLFDEGSSGFGKVMNFNKVDLSNYVQNKFGTNTARLYRAEVISNKFGTQTIALVPK
tara:strand:- start:1391 stop:2440 length:1050 start_codon:yes stop_codon:yes gene_type:complete